MFLTFTGEHVILSGIAWLLLKWLHVNKKAAGEVCGKAHSPQMPTGTQTRGMGRGMGDTESELPAENFQKCQALSVEPETGRGRGMENQNSVDI